MHASSRERRVQTDSERTRPRGAPRVRDELQITRPLVVSAEWNGINVVRKWSRKGTLSTMTKGIITPTSFLIVFEKAYH